MNCTKMRIHPLCLLLVVAVSTIEATTKRPTTNCIIGCRCNETDVRQVKIYQCDSPITLTKDALSGVSNTSTDFYIRNVFIKRIHNDAFSDFKQLERVIIEDANIESIDSDAFDLPEMTGITFTKTIFGEIPQITAEYVQELIFKECKLTKVPNLDNVPALEFLNLQNNLIKEIDEATFSLVKNLDEVNLANNSISKLPRNLFKNNTDFSVLNLNYNPLVTFDLDITFLEHSRLTGKVTKESSLESLSLAHCNLTSFNRSVTENLVSLISLNLSDNQISVFEIDVFAPLKELNYIYLSNNKLVDLDDDIFYENSRLDGIVLDNNQFEALPKFKTRGDVFRTSRFSCKNCGLTSVVGAFDSMTGLVSLDLSNNKLTSIDGVFVTSNTLQQLFLSNNQIATIGINSFAKISQLQILDLSNNPLLPLDPVVFTSLPQMKKLDVSGANLRQLWTNHNAELPALEQLVVDHNQLSSISVGDVKIMPKLQSINLDGNPLVCEENLEFVDYVLKNNIYPVSPKTHEDFKRHAELIDTPTTNWTLLFPCFADYSDLSMDNKMIIDNIDDNNIDIDNYDDEDDDDADYETESYNAVVEASVLNTSGLNLAKASYILSVTSVFILTALLVLFVAVLVTLLILKRNKSFNMHNGNLPRLKIPLWHTTPGQKKHSGSVYRPLSEELSGSRTPIINRYEFKQTPQIHNSLH